MINKIKYIFMFVIADHMNFANGQASKTLYTWCVTYVYKKNIFNVSRTPGCYWKKCPREISWTMSKKLSYRTSLEKKPKTAVPTSRPPPLPWPLNVLSELNHGNWRYWAIDSVRTDGTGLYTPWELRVLGYRLRENWRYWAIDSVRTEGTGL